MQHRLKMSLSTGSQPNQTVYWFARFQFNSHLFQKLLSFKFQNQMAITHQTGETVVDTMDAMIDNVVHLVNIEMVQGTAELNCSSHLREFSSLLVLRNYDVGSPSYMELSLQNN